MASILFRIITLFILVIGAGANAWAQNKEQNKSQCAAMDRPCLMKEIEGLAGRVDRTEWRDMTYRELAKTYAYEGNYDKAISLIGQVTGNDTKAMTIRGIGMAAASRKADARAHTALFAKLKDEAGQITHPPSQGIAFTYIAMSQAFAGLDADARATAAGMENGALRNKAYGETAEIEAERGDLKNALASLSAIDAQSYRNKAYDTVSRIFLDKAYVNEAYVCASRIDNAYLKAKAIQRILNKGNAEEEDMEPAEDLSKDF